MNFTDQQHSSVLLEKLWSQREAGRFCDVVLHVQGQKFLAHRNVLASCSPFFDSVLKTRKVVKEQLTITCQNLDAFQLLLNYFYTGAIVIDKGTVSEVLRLANHFLVAKIKNYCAEYLNRYLDASNCFSARDLAEKYSLPSLLKNACNFIHKYAPEVMKQNEILDFPFSKLDSLLKDKQFNFPSHSLLNCISRWVEHDIDSRQSNFDALLSYIKWDSVDSQLLYEHIKTCSLFYKSPKCLYTLLLDLKNCGVNIEDYRITFQSLQEQFGFKQENDVETNASETVTLNSENSKVQNSESNIEENAPVTVALLEKESSKENQPNVLTETTEATKPLSTDSDNSNSDGQDPDFGINDYDDDTQTSEADYVDSAPVNGYDVSQKSDSSNSKSKSPETKKTVPPLKIRRPPVKATRKRRRTASKPAKKGAKQSKAAQSTPKQKAVKRYVSETDTDDDDEDENDQEDDGSSSATDSSCQDEGLNGYGGKLRWKDGVKCPHCSYVAHSSVRLEQHVSRIHAKDVTYKCKVCEFTCKWNREYYMHMKSHFQGPPFRCETCEYTCDRIQFLLSHQMRHTDERPFKCDECDHRCRTKANLDCHMRCHTGEKPYQCEHCERRFAIKASLDQHLASHREDRPFLCDTCGFSTKYQSHLFSHKRIHTGDVFHCQFPDCKYSTPKKSQLGSHHRTHTAVRSHICAICGRAFIEKSHLVRHERIHLNEKPFKCELCDYSSSRKDKLKEHFRKHHSENATAVLPYRPRKQRRQAAAENAVPSYAIQKAVIAEPDNQIPPLIELAEAVTAAATAVGTSAPAPGVYTYETTPQENLHAHTAVTLQQMDAVAHNYQIAFMEPRHHQPIHHHHHLQHTLAHSHPHVGPTPPIAVPAIMTDQNRVVVSSHDGTTVVTPQSEYNPYMQFM